MVNLLGELAAFIFVIFVIGPGLTALLNVSDAMGMLIIIGLIRAVYFSIGSFSGPQEDQVEFRENFAFGSGCLIFIISMIIFISGLFLIFNGVIGIGFMLLCLSGLMNWGVAKLRD